MEGLYSSIKHAQKQYRYVIEHAVAMLAPAGGKELYSLRGNAQKQYRYVIEHASAMLAPAKGGTVFIDTVRAEAV